MLTLGQCARLVGCGKSTMTRAISQGKLSAERLADGSYRIDPSELARAYGLTLDRNANGEWTVTKRPVTETVAQPETPAETPAHDAGTLARLAAAEAEIAGLKMLVTEMRSASEKAERAAREEVAAWREQAQRLALAGPQAPQASGWWPFRRRA